MDGVSVYIIWFSLTLQTPLCVSVYIIWKTFVKQNTSSNWNGSQNPKRHLVGFPLARKPYYASKRPLTSYEIPLISSRPFYGISLLTVY